MGVVIKMENYIMGSFRQKIFASDKGYIIGLFKIKSTDMESMKDYVNKTITITGYFHELNQKIKMGLSSFYQAIYSQVLVRKWLAKLLIL